MSLRREKGFQIKTVEVVSDAKIKKVNNNSHKE